MEKILFATDFSSNADKAFKFALNLAEKRKADLVMVHVFDIKTVWTYPYTNDPFDVRPHRGLPPTFVEVRFRRTHQPA